MIKKATTTPQEKWTFGRPFFVWNFALSWLMVTVILIAAVNGATTGLLESLAWMAGVNIMGTMAALVGGRGWQTIIAARNGGAK